MRRTALLSLATFLVVGLVTGFLGGSTARGDQTSARARLEKDGIPYSAEAFFDAVGRGDVERTKLFLEAGIDPATQNSSRRTALWVATERRQLDTLKALLAEGVAPTGKNAPPADAGKTVVFEAVDTGEAEYVRALVEAGADAKAANDYGVPPLAEAARTGNLEMCQILLKAGADPNAAPSGFPLLFGPINENHFEVVKLLLDSGARLGEHKADLLQAATDPEIRALLEAAE